MSTKTRKRKPRNFGAEIEKVDAGDVYMWPLSIETCKRCDNYLEDSLSAAPATQLVTLDIRQYCDRHAEEVVAELRSVVSLSGERPRTRLPEDLGLIATLMSISKRGFRFLRRCW